MPYAKKKKYTKGKKPAGTKTFNKKVEQVILKHEAKTVEHKYFDVVTPLTTLSSTASIFDLSGTTVGTSDIQRIGDNIVPKSLEFNFWLNGETFSSIVRVVVFRWMPNSVPAIGNLLHSAELLSPFVHDLRHLFNVLYDKTIIVANNGNEIYSSHNSLKMAKKNIEYQLGTSGGANKVYCMFLTDRNLATSCIGRLYSRLNYIDP